VAKSENGKQGLAKEEEMRNQDHDVDDRMARKNMCPDVFGRIISMKSGDSMIYYTGTRPPTNIRQAVRIAFMDGHANPVLRKIAHAQYDHIVQRI